MSESEQSTEILVQGIGQLVNLDQPREVALAIDAIRDLEYHLREAKKDLTRALVYASQQEGSKTLRYEGVEVTVKGGTFTSWDEAGLYTALIDAGMSEERAGEIVVHKVSLQVSANEANRAAKANPAYAEIIETHKTVGETLPSVSVSVKNLGGAAS